MHESKLFWARRHAVLAFPLIFLACGSNSSSSSPPPPPPPPPVKKQLPVWTNNFYGIPFTMVGTDPSIPGSGTTTVPVEIIPVTFTFTSYGVTLSPQNSACGDSVSMVARITQSPVFTTNTWMDQGTLIGKTQYPDAYQRANLWSVVSTSSPNYHVLLQPVSVTAAISVEGPASAVLQSNPNPLCPQPLVSIPVSCMDSVVQQYVSAQQITADTLPIFVTYNMIFLPSPTTTWLGYHNVRGGQTYAVASYNDPSFNLFGYDSSDIAVLSHEIGEWMDNPLGVNKVPAWGNMGIQQGCNTDLEVGDPLSGNSFPMPTATFTYHVQELAYFSWFARNIPSLALNGRYSSQGTFLTPAAPCP